MRKSSIFLFVSMAALLAAPLSVVQSRNQTEALETGVSQIVYSYNKDGSNGKPLGGAVLSKESPRIHFVPSASSNTTYVKFYLDGVLVEKEGDAPWGLEDDDGPNPLPSNLSKMGAGKHMVQAVVTENGRYNTYSAVYTVIINEFSASTTSSVISSTAKYTKGLKIAPSQRGSGDGSSWENAASLSKLPSLISATPDGGDILLLADSGSYTQTSALNIRSGGASGKPITIRGVAKDGTPMKAKIVGNRTTPYRPSGRVGNGLFKLYKGSNNLEFRDLSFENIGNVFNASGDVNNLTIENTYGKNIRRFISNYRSSTETSANIVGLTVRNAKVDGFSKSFARIQHNSNKLLFEDIIADSQKQDGDNFAMGFHYDGTAHDITHRRVTIKNTIQTKSSASYWNGDGFATERGVYNVLFEDTNAMGATDGGYDLKSSKTRLVRAKASDNKRNFRLWGKDVIVESCEGINPYKRGGTSSQAQVWVGKYARVKFIGCTFSDKRDNTVVFDLDTGANVVIESTKITRSSESTLRRLDSGSRLVIN